MVEYASTFLMSSLHERQHRADEDRDAADQRHEVHAAGRDREALVEHRVEAGGEEHAGDDHGGGVDERRHRRGAGHRVGQPGVERELAALADDADEQARSRRRGAARGRRPRSSAYALIPSMLNVPAAKNMMMMPIIRPMSPVRVVRNALSAALEFSLLLPPVPDQRERAEADAFPADEHLQRVVGDDERAASTR